MKYRIFSHIKIAAASLTATLFLLACLSSCTRDDIDNGYLSQGLDSPMSFGAITSSSLTKGTGSVVEKVGSEELGTLNGETLYLTMERTLWEDEVATKVTPYTTGSELKSEKVDFGFIAYTQAEENSAVNTWTLYQTPTTATYDDGIGYWVPTTSGGDGIPWPNVNKKIHFFVYAPLDAAPISNATAASNSEPTLQVGPLGTTPNSQKDLLIANDVADDKIPYTTIGSSLVSPYILTFDHALAAIRFKVVKKSPAIEISSVEISGVFDKGTVNMNSGEWSSLQNSGLTYSISDPQTETRTGDPNYLYFKDEYTLMMIPNTFGSTTQSFGSTAKITVRFVGGAKIEHTIKNHEWRAGYALTYVIDNVIDDSANYDYVFTATAEPTYNTGTADKKIDYTGAPVTGQVVSYKEHKTTHAKTPVTWSVEGYYTTEAGANNADFSKRIRNGIQGAFISTFEPTLGAGSTDATTGESYTITHPAPVATSRTVIDTGSERDARIAATASKGTAANPWNLANGSQGRVINSSTNTANAYIINGPGYYCFPIVMGNGVKNGANNEVAYNQPNFVNYANRPITDPYLRGLADSQGVPTHAVLLWEDKGSASPGTQKSIIDVYEPNGLIAGNGGAFLGSGDYFLKYPASGVVDGISTTGSGDNIVYWVNFYVPAATQQGLAQIAVLDEKLNPEGYPYLVMWSWLIWLTDYQPGVGDIDVEYLKDAAPTSTDNTVGTVTFMPNPLGWVDNGLVVKESYPKADVYVRLVQSETLDYKVVKLVRPAANNVKIQEQVGHAPFYQWGRSGALHHGNGLKEDANEVNFREFGGYYRTAQSYSGPANLVYAIRNPIHFFAGGYFWCNTNIINLWDADNDTEYLQTDCADSKVVKTIYDPSPAGYTVPRGSAFNAFVLGRLDSESVDPYNNLRGPRNWSKSWERGAFFFTNFRSSSSVAGTGEIFLPALGRRQFQRGSLASGLQDGYYWSAQAAYSNGSTHAYALRFSTNYT